MKILITAAFLGMFFAGIVIMFGGGLFAVFVALIVGIVIGAIIGLAL